MKLVAIFAVLAGLVLVGEAVTRAVDVPKEDFSTADDFLTVVGHWKSCLKRLIIIIINLNKPVDTDTIIEFTVTQNGTDEEVSKQNATVVAGQTKLIIVILVPSCYEDYWIYWIIIYKEKYWGIIWILKCMNGNGKKDPHLSTFSGVHYNFQGYCSYTLVKDCRSDTPSFDISADFRGRDSPTEPPTRMVAVTTRLSNGHTYTFLDDNSIWVDGHLLLDRSLDLRDNIGYVHAKDDSVLLELHHSGLSLLWTGKYHEASVTVGNDEFMGKLCGMFGNGDPERGQDLVKSNGMRTTNVTEFAESWVIPGSCPN
ncbi:kielin/chordin-like protein [Ptychodera flava]|uniref:kielin/chordin-like protein n=1 Tax=Ptychodera flava TaxID=63121 RepID=UPI00396AA55C